MRPPALVSLPDGGGEVPQCRVTSSRLRPLVRASSHQRAAPKREPREGRRCRRPRCCVVKEDNYSHGSHQVLERDHDSLGHLCGAAGVHDDCEVLLRGLVGRSEAFLVLLHHRLEGDHLPAIPGLEPDCDSVMVITTVLT